MHDLLGASLWWSQPDGDVSRGNGVTAMGLGIAQLLADYCAREEEEERRKETTRAVRINKSSSMAVQAYRLKGARKRITMELLERLAANDPQLTELKDVPRSVGMRKLATALTPTPRSRTSGCGGAGSSTRTHTSSLVC
jgi:hypothetical protein